MPGRRIRSRCESRSVFFSLILPLFFPLLEFLPLLLLVIGMADDDNTFASVRDNPGPTGRDLDADPGGGSYGWRTRLAGRAAGCGLARFHFGDGDGLTERFADVRPTINGQAIVARIGDGEVGLAACPVAITGDRVGRT